MTRAVPEWIADHDDQAIPPRVKLRIWERCAGKCALTGRKLRPGDPYDFDHIIALINGGQHREFNLQVVTRVAHKEKTAEDLAIKSKTYRMAAKFNGTWPKSKAKIRSRGFSKRGEYLGGAK
jgi:5-methylcytosine-specific restriction protein A